MKDYKGKYFIQTSGYVGNSCLWWGENRCGYTTNLEKAGLYSKEEAMSICKGSDDDVAWPAEYIISVSSTHVDMQNLKKRKLSRAWRGRRK